MKKAPLSTVFLITISSIILLSCSKKTPPVIPKFQPALTKGSYTPGNVSGACDCGPAPSGCSDFVTCARKFIGSGNSKLFNLYWKSCAGPVCTFAGPGPVSTANFCFIQNTCDKLNCIITPIPDCLPCLPDPFCITLQMKCKSTLFSNNYALTGTYIDPSTGETWHVDITDDPKITVSCGFPGNEESCSGELR